MIVAVLLLSGCSSPKAITTTPYTVKLSPLIIDAAINKVKDSPAWGISLLDVTINFLKGVAVEGAIVLHNGEDTEKLVTLTYSPTTKPIERDGKTYSPIDASGWVKIKEPELRLQAHETRTVTITVYIPKDVTLASQDFGFGIKATGSSIFTQTEVVEVATGETTTDATGKVVPDNFLDINLAVPIMSGDIKSISSVTSSLGESLQPTRYDAGKKVLHIEGLKPSATRTITLVYESTHMINIAYVQQWYISMME